MSQERSAAPWIAPEAAGAPLMAWQLRCFPPLLFSAQISVGYYEKILPPRCCPALAQAAQGKGGVPSPKPVDVALGDVGGLGNAGGMAGLIILGSFTNLNNSIGL